MNRFDPTVEKILLRNGWFEGRQVAPVPAASDDFELFPVARPILEEFYGLRYCEDGPGVECARVDVIFRPSAAAHFDGAKERLFCPLGVIESATGGLMVDSKGRIYTSMEGYIDYYAHTFDRAIEKLLLGKKPDDPPVGCIYNTYDD